MWGGDTLHELRVALTLAEQEIAGGLSQRISPLAQVAGTRWSQGSEIESVYNESKHPTRAAHGPHAGRAGCQGGATASASSLLPRCSMIWAALPPGLLFRGAALIQCLWVRATLHELWLGLQHRMHVQSNPMTSPAAMRPASCALIEMHSAGKKEYCCRPCWNESVTADVQVRDAGNLLTRAGLSIPSVDLDDMTVHYSHPDNLVQHLRYARTASLYYPSLHYPRLNQQRED